MKENVLNKIDNDENYNFFIKFFSVVENGSRDNITPKGCLSLARCGSTLWNIWREANPSLPIGHGIDYSNIADFSNIDFTHEQIDFSGFKFGDGAKFNFCKWERYADFFQAEWGDNCEFIGTVWGKRSFFSLAKWGDNCTFEGSFWDHDAIFECAIFGNNINMSNTYWGERIFFNGSKFGNNLNLNLSTWREDVSFSSTGISGLSNITMLNPQDDRTDIVLTAISDSNFNNVSFQGVEFNGCVHFTNRDFKGCLNFSPFISENNKWKIQRDTDGCAIQKNGKLDYSDIKIQKIQTSFKKVPNFIGAKITSCTSFDEAIFPKAIGSEYAIIRYRYLRDLFSKLTATMEEQRFFKLEMKEESLKDNIGSNFFVYFLYDFFSDFGFSFFKPLFYLVLSFIIFTLIFLSFSNEFYNIDNLEKAIEFNLIYLFYGDGTLFDNIKTQLLCPKFLHSIFITIMMVLEKFIIFLFIFLMGLSLRNMFRIK